MSAFDEYLAEKAAREALAIKLGWKAPTSDSPYMDPDDPSSGMNDDWYWKHPQGHIATLPMLEELQANK